MNYGMGHTGFPSSFSKLSVIETLGKLEKGRSSEIAGRQKVLFSHGGEKILAPILIPGCLNAHILA